MNLVWTLLRKNIKKTQLAGFFTASAAGLFIIMLALRFYGDISPVLDDEGTLGRDYLTITKPVSTASSLFGSSRGFSEKEIKDLRDQPFTREVGRFTASDYKVYATINIAGVHLSTALFFESVPDQYIDVQTKDWRYAPGGTAIPIILPRKYLDLYNFGFAKSQGLPQLGEKTIGMITPTIIIRGRGMTRKFQGRIVGFSQKLNTILVPEDFMQWSNSQYSTGRNTNPSRLLLKVDNPSDQRLATYLHSHGIELDSEGLVSSRAIWLLKLVTGVIVAIGLLISLLAMGILILSTYLLLERNSDKIHDLLLIGYSSSRVARPYYLLTLTLSAGAFVLALLLTHIARGAYLLRINEFLPITGTSACTSLLAGALITLAATTVNCIIIKKKIK